MKPIREAFTDAIGISADSITFDFSYPRTRGINEFFEIKDEEKDFIYECYVWQQEGAVYDTYVEWTATTPGAVYTCAQIEHDSGAVSLVVYRRHNKKNAAKHKASRPVKIHWVEVLRIYLYSSAEWQALLAADAAEKAAIVAAELAEEKRIAALRQEERANEYSAWLE